MKSRRKLARVSEEMKQWSALLEAELSAWPAVTTRRMFGMLVFYRKGRIFAALPRTRSFDTPRSVAFKLKQKTPQLLKLLRADARISSTWNKETKWISYELSSAADLTEALKWFDLAYRNCLSRQN
jgi:hypothetical protein